MNKTEQEEAQSMTTAQREREARTTLEQTRAAHEEARIAWEKEDTEKRAEVATTFKTKPTSEALVYSASARCPCGAGLAYPAHCGTGGAWDCSAILLGTADPNVEHTDKLPFAFYEVKSEVQPSAQGLTTRHSDN